MKIQLLFILLIAICAKTSAQDSGFGEYHHTINYSDHKITFQVQEMGEERRFTDPAHYYHWFGSNQIKVTQGGFSGKLLDGSYAAYYLNQQLKEKGRFNLGLKTGEWNSWTEQGILLSKFQYKDGVLWGPFTKFDTLGNVNEKGTYKNGQLHGRFTKTIAKDSVQVVRYSNGKLRPAATDSSWNSRLLFWKKIKKVK